VKFIKKYCVKSDNGYDLNINDDETIKIKFYKKKDHKYVKLALLDAIKFIEFVNKYELYCDGGCHSSCKIKDHSCRYDEYTEKYLKYVTENNLVDHINDLIDFGFKNLHSEYFSPQTVFYCICQYSSLDCIKKFVAYFDLEDREYFLRASKRKTTEVMDYLLTKHEEYLYAYFVNGNSTAGLENLCRDQQCHEVDYHNVLLFLLIQNNVFYFKYFVYAMEATIEKIKKWSVEKNLTQEFGRCIKSLSLTQWRKERLLFKCIESDLPKIAKLLLPRDDVNIKCFVSNAIPELDKNSIANILLKNNRIGMLKLLLERGTYNRQEINTMFKKSYECDYNVVKILIDNGADYNIYGKQVMYGAKKCDNQKVVSYLNKFNVVK